jgi:hypothetical protein
MRLERLSGALAPLLALLVVLAPAGCATGGNGGVGKEDAAR